VEVQTVAPSPTVGNYFINNRGDISFIAALNDGASGLYIRDHATGSLRVVARTGMTISGVGTIDNLTLLINGGILNDSGQVFFFATLTDGSGVLLVASPRP
jgi:hypothetical protein